MDFEQIWKSLSISGKKLAIAMSVFEWSTGGKLDAVAFVAEMDELEVASPIKELYQKKLLEVVTPRISHYETKISPFTKGSVQIPVYVFDVTELGNAEQRFRLTEEFYKFMQEQNKENE